MRGPPAPVLLVQKKHGGGGGLQQPRPPDPGLASSKGRQEGLRGVLFEGVGARPAGPQARLRGEDDAAPAAGRPAVGRGCKEGFFRGVRGRPHPGPLRDAPAVPVQRVGAGGSRGEGAREGGYPGGHVRGGEVEDWADGGWGGVCVRAVCVARGHAVVGPALVVVVGVVVLLLLGFCGCL